MGWEGREARDAGRGTHRAARQRHLTDATLHVYGQCKGCSSRDIWLHITLIGLPEPRTATSGAADWNMEFHWSGCGRDPQLSTEGRGGSDGTGAPEAGAVCFAFGGWLSSPMLLYQI